MKGTQHVVKEGVRGEGMGICLKITGGLLFGQCDELVISSNGA